jgi:hypothetical protein
MDVKGCGSVALDGMCGPARRNQHIEAGDGVSLKNRIGIRRDAPPTLA